MVSHGEWNDRQLRGVLLEKHPKPGGGRSGGVGYDVTIRCRLTRPCRRRAGRCGCGFTRTFGRTRSSLYGFSSVEERALFEKADRRERDRAEAGHHGVVGIQALDLVRIIRGSDVASSGESAGHR